MIEQMMIRGQEPPSWAVEPLIDPYHEFYIRQFWELTTERPMGYTVGPIPTSRIRDTGSRLGLDVHMMELFVNVIRRLDGAYLKYVESEQQEQRAARSRQNGRLQNQGRSRPPKR